MKFTNVRLTGFKSFVEPTDFVIQDGLTGVVGPNGCGKSNLLEALRWVMGATSAKALRGDGMDAVIFSGTSMRPARNWAEVTLSLDNSDRTAPAEYNDTETLEVSRRILRKDEGTQSIYRINGKEARAKDVQLLFADASTGANSPALVRQGQISELISAKPQNRRRLLEEAAGVTGLHTRRHEAELRLRAAEQNLARLDDVIGELETQKAALARQARQATRYRNVSGDIRKAEAMQCYLRWRDARESAEEAQKAHEQAVAAVSEAAAAASAAMRAREVAHDAIEPLRLDEAQTAAGLNRLTHAREQLEAEARRAQAEAARIADDLKRAAADLERETTLKSDADAAIEQLKEEERLLITQRNGESDALRAAQADMSDAAAQLSQAETISEDRQGAVARAEADHRAFTDKQAAAKARERKLSAEICDFEAEREAIAPTSDDKRALELAEARLIAAEEADRRADAAFAQASAEREAAERAAAACRAPLREAERRCDALTAEADGLRKILANADDPQRPVIDEITVEPGLEDALAAALGDDLGASLDASAPAHWSALGETELAGALPEGLPSLAQFVETPPVLRRRLAAIGLADAEDAPMLAARLRPGQRLVTRQGDLFRWDGFVALSGAKSAAATRFEQRNRLQSLVIEIEEAGDAVAALTKNEQGASERANLSARLELQARELARDARRSMEKARAEHGERERAHDRAQARLAAIGDALERLANDRAEARRQAEEAQQAQAAMAPLKQLREEAQQASETMRASRERANAARSRLGDLERSADARNARLKAIAAETSAWSKRAEAASARRAGLVERRDALHAEEGEIADRPNEIERQQKELIGKISSAEKRRNDAADALERALNAAREADGALRAAETAASETREARARLEAQIEAGAERIREAVALAQENCEAGPEELLAIAQHKEREPLPAREAVERRLERYKRERENLGGVNLRADEELAEVAERFETICREREDCDGAIRKLRAGIGGLNREARQRLLDAFDTVNRNFASLFARLFNGGTAELRLIDSEDPLDAGLEIMASPPGKKLAAMSLMSGGEQALTATALIFAVFMANPAPVCVLDEVDAPLDDANVERFCLLLREMSGETQTRFIIITHHALTMSRMDRLFGVTMIERGVSQLVSVDLTKAEQLAAAE